MRLRAFAVTLLLPVGLLAACGDDDGGITAREDTTTTGDRADRTTTTEESADTTETTEASADTTETTETTEPSADTTETTEASSETTSGSEETIAPGVTVDDLVDQIVESGIAQDREQAECFVNGILDVFTVEELVDIGTAGGDGADVFADLTPEQQGELVEIIGECGLPVGS
jgi:hypothetical protein